MAPCWCFRGYFIDFSMKLKLLYFHFRWIRWSNKEEGSRETRYCKRWRVVYWWSLWIRERYIWGGSSNDNTSCNDRSRIHAGDHYSRLPQRYGKDAGEERWTEEQVSYAADKMCQKKGRSTQNLYGIYIYCAMS